MSFRDFNDEGPGTVEWDIVLGQNTTGLFPEEEHYVLEGDELTSVTFSHAGGGAMEPSAYGLSWTVENISPVNKPLFGDEWFTFEQDGIRYKAVINKKFRQSKDCLVVDVEEV